MKLRKHHVLIRPANDKDSSWSYLTPDIGYRAYVHSGYVEAVGKVEEDIKVGDFVTFTGWQEERLREVQFAPWTGDKYTLHEDDIDLVVEDW